MKIMHSGKFGRMSNELELNADEIIAGLGNLNRRFSGKRILITGAAGFLGCQLIHYFEQLKQSGTLDEPCKVFAWDNYIRGIPTWLDDLKNNSMIFIQEKDITVDSDYPEPDFIIHAASIASPTFYRKHPIETINANVIGLQNLLEYCKNKTVESFLFFSTSEIYGDPDSANIPTHEEYRGFVSCTGPRACYDESKRLGETLCVNYWQTYGVPVKITRPFNNYGPGLKITDKRVIPDFFSDVINNRDISILSDGKSTRTFCYISDAIEGYIRILLSDYNGEPFNIGTSQPEISMVEVAKKIVEISGKNLSVKYERSNDSDYLTDNPQRRCPSIEKAINLIGYNPKVSLEEGLKRTYDYYIAHPLAEEL